MTPEDMASALDDFARAHWRDVCFLWPGRLVAFVKPPFPMGSRLVIPVWQSRVKSLFHHYGFERMELEWTRVRTGARFRRLAIYGELAVVALHPGDVGPFCQLLDTMSAS